MASVYRSNTLSVSIERQADQVYEYIREARNLPHWANGLCRSIRESDGEWVIETPDGPATIRFVERNRFGVLDHVVTLLSGRETLVPMRVMANGGGCEVILSVFQLPGVPDAAFADDAALVHKDLQALKSVLER
ncbi:hypothetical protein SD70_28765 [Gordoniibacillus kamchatkensis]|uniref:Polyketide cyclase n=1 Tax=Gordoniibacillus kamchatkensis TaxID=1590651 RepID=A0ABR5ACF8_9BACL|nr:hypothetical protein [Paenibacillus sp. VKM B-2647]KIL38067.1 hypothetical protein SD70_28765 [Paenibacillus sp. VKM B-2647]